MCKDLPTHGRHSSIICLADMFKSLQPAERKKPLNMTYTSGDIMMHATCYQSLCTVDMRLIQAIVARASLVQIPLNVSDPVDAQQKRLAKMILDDTGNREGVYCFVEGTWAELADEMGYNNPGGSQSNSIVESMRRINNVNLEFTTEAGITTRKLVKFEIDKVNRAFIAALSPTIAAAVLRESGFVHIDMAEVRALKSDPARLLHQKFCALVWVGTSGKNSIGKCMEYVYPSPAKSRQTKSYRRGRIVEALEEIESLPGWEIRVSNEDKIKITRSRNKL